MEGHIIFLSQEQLSTDKWEEVPIYSRQGVVVELKKE